MKFCYAPSILFFILAMGFMISRSTLWDSINEASIPLFIGIISFILCNQGYTIMTWIILVCYIFTFHLSIHKDLFTGKVIISYHVWNYSGDIYF